MPAGGGFLQKLRTLAGASKGGVWHSRTQSCTNPVLHIWEMPLCSFQELREVMLVGRTGEPTDTLSQDRASKPSSCVK